MSASTLEQPHSLSRVGRFMTGLTVVVSIQSVLMSVSAFRHLPLSTGWFLLWFKESTERTIYTDFFFPLPPLALWIEGGIPSAFGNPVEADVWLQIVKWLLISGVIFAIGEHFYGPLIAAIASTFALSVYYVQPHNIVAGYFELLLLFVLTSLLTFLKSIRQTHNHVLLFLSGFFLGSAILVKQSALLLLPAAMMLVLVYTAKSRYTNQLSSFANRYLAYGAGLISPIVVAIIVANYRGNLSPMISDIFSFAEKNPEDLHWVSWFIEGVIPSSSVPVWTIGIAAISYFASTKFGKLNKSHVGLYYFVGLGVLGIGAFIDAHVNDRPTSWLGTQLILLLSIWSLSAIFYFGARNRETSTYDKPLTYAGILLSSAIAVILGLRYSRVFHEAGVETTAFITGLIGTSTVLLFLFALWKTFTNERGKVRQHFAQLCSALGLGLLFALMNAASGGLTIESWLLPLAIILGFGLRQMSLKMQPRAIMAGTVLLTGLLTPLAAQMVHSPYSWWGMTSLPLSQQNVPSKIVPLQPFSLSEYDVERFEAVDEIISIQQTITSQKTGILLGPNVAGLAASVYDLKTYKLQCPILWWDVCPDNVASQDFESIRTHPPAVVLWNFAPPSVGAGHEAAFRDGRKSSISAIQDYFADSIINGTYTVVSKFPSGADPEKRLECAEEDWCLKILTLNPKATIKD